MASKMASVHGEIAADLATGLKSHFDPGHFDPGHFAFAAP